MSFQSRESVTAPPGPLSIPDSPSFNSYWENDTSFQSLMIRLLPATGQDWARDNLVRMGRRAALEATPLAGLADRHGPTLRSHDARGNRVDVVQYHPAYHALESIAYGEGLASHAHDPVTRGRLPGGAQIFSHGLAYLFAQAECGLYCPVTMTDSLARVLSRWGTTDQVERWMGRLTSRNLHDLAQGAMFLTERRGGSDVGLSETVARRDGAGWRLHGHKWFCSKVDADLALVLARLEDGGPGTEGLGLFMMPRRLLDGSLNSYRIERLKEKLGVRSMPTGEVILEGAWAEPLGPLEHGFATMTEMINACRLHNSIASIALTRRVVNEVRYFLDRRIAFGRRVSDHILARTTLEAMDLEQRAALHLVFRCVALREEIDLGDETKLPLFRFLNSLSKYWTARLAVRTASEGMELAGGNGYIEDSPFCRLLRDSQVLPIWEGTSNIQILECLRTIEKHGAGVQLLAWLREAANRSPESSAGEAALLGAATCRLDRDLIRIMSMDEPEVAFRAWLHRACRAVELAAVLEQGSMAAETQNLTCYLTKHIDSDTPPPD